MHKNTRSLLAILIAFAAITSSAEDRSAKNGDISRTQARTVVLTFLKYQGFKTESPQLDLEDDHDSKAFPGFYMFHAYYDTATRLDSIGTYAVDRRTSALWDRMTCKQLESGALKPLQHMLTELTGASESKIENANTKPCL